MGMMGGREAIGQRLARALARVPGATWEKVGVRETQN